MIRFFSAAMLLISFCCGCKEPIVRDLLVRTVIESEVLGEPRNLSIQLPLEYYSETTKQQRYPVLVLLDGNTYLQPTINTIETLNKEVGQQPISPIIVAIESPDREKDFTFTKIETVRENHTGGGLIFLNFLEDELIPYIDHHYKTNQSRMLIGHSLGGLCVLNIFLSENVTFQSFIASDPSIWWESAMIEQKLTEAYPNYQNKSLFIATAFRDSTNQSKNLEKHQQIAQIISNKTGISTSLIHQYYPGETHRSIPSAAFRDGLEICSKLK